MSVPLPIIPYARMVSTNQRRGIECATNGEVTLRIGFDPMLNSSVFTEVGGGALRFQFVSATRTAALRLSQSLRAVPICAR